MPGRPFLQIPGPTLVPERIVRAMSQPIIDHRGPRFAALVQVCLDGLHRVFQTRTGHVILYPGSGTGAWEAAIVNTLSPGDRVLACVNGHFSTGFARTAEAYGIECERVEVPYGDGVAADVLERRLRADAAHQFKALLVVHNETSTGVTSNVAAVRAALDRAGHPALLLVDTVSSLASIDFSFEDWVVGGARAGARDPLPEPRGVLEHAHRSRDAAGVRLGRVRPPRLPPAQPVARRRARRRQGQSLPHRPSRQSERARFARRARRRGDDAEGLRRARGARSRAGRRPGVPAELGGQWGSDRLRGSRRHPDYDTLTSSPSWFVSPGRRG